MRKNITTTELGEVEPCIKGEYTFANLKNVLPSYVADSVVEGVHGFSRFIHDFDRIDAVLSGVVEQNIKSCKNNKETMNL